jgi:hypothetical protein
MSDYLIRCCPFCDSAGKVESTTFGDSDTKYYRVRCAGPDAHCLDHWSDSEHEAVTVWNKRRDSSCECGCGTNSCYPEGHHYSNEWPECPICKGAV